MAHRVGFNTLSLAANCIDRSRAARCCLRKICPHGPPSLLGRFLLCQSRHVTIALQLFFAPIFAAIPSCKRPKYALPSALPRRRYQTPRRNRRGSANLKGLSDAEPARLLRVMNASAFPCRFPISLKPSDELVMADQH